MGSQKGPKNVIFWTRKNRVLRRLWNSAQLTGARTAGTGAAAEAVGAAARIPKTKAAEDSKPARAPALPITPSVEERRLHDLTHLPFRNWCGVCVAARAQDPGHHRQLEGAPPTIPVLQVDFFFLNRKRDTDHAVGLTMAASAFMVAIGAKRYRHF